MADAGTAAPAGSDAAASATLQATRALMWLLVVPVLALLAVLTALQYRQRLLEAEHDLQRRAVERAAELEAMSRPVIAHVADLHELMRAAWTDPPDPGAALQQALRPHTAAGRSDGWSLDGASDAERRRFGQFWWERADGAPPPTPWVRRAALFVEAARVVHHRDPLFAATWFAAAGENTSFGYPWIPTAGMLAAYGLSSLREIDGPRAAGVAKAEAALRRSPERLAFWGSPYVSQLDRELVVSHVKMLVLDGRYVGEVSVDVRLAPLQQRLADWRTDGRAWVADDGGRVLADSAAPLLPPAGQALADTRVAVALTDRVPTTLRDAAANAGAASGRLERVGGDVLVSARRAGAPWSYVEAVPAAALRAQVWPTLRPNALLGLALVVVFLAGQWLLAHRFVEPALAVLGYLRSLSRDADTPPPALGARWRTWVDEVGDVFRTHRALQRRERRTEVFKSAIVDNAGSAIATTDVDGRIVEFNPAAERMFGLRRDAAIGHVLGEVLVPERHRAAHRAQMQRLRAGERIGGVGQPTEMVGLRADGSEFPLEMLVVRIDFDGQVFYTGFMTDLTERRAALREIERQREALRQSEKLGAMGSLLAGVAHELNNPLAIVMGRASLLEEKTEGTDAAADARRIREAAERCGRIVRTFLDMARQRPAVRTAVQLNHVVRGAADMLGYTLRSHGIELQLDLAEPLPDVQADAGQVGQIVLNLIVNAQQALAGIDGPRRIGVQTGVDRGGAGGAARVWLRMTDTGRGVPAASREQIFEPFFTTKPDGMGTGVGLAVSRSLARDHGGDLVAEEAARGASFLLTLPLAQAAGAAAPADDVAVLPHGVGGRVLVVDDEPEIAAVVRELLENAGYEVASAESGAVALELLGEARFDAVVSDLRMPDMDGAALWRAVRARDPVLARRMLFVTGDTLSPSARAFLDASRCGRLEKPFAPAELLARLQATLERGADETLPLHASRLRND